MDENHDGLKAGPCREKPCYEVGILFVHGIGAQKRGQTLAEFGGPVYSWLVDRFDGLDQRWRQAARLGKNSITNFDAWRTRIEEWADDDFPLESRPKNEIEELDALDSLVKTAITDQLSGCDTVVGRVSLSDTVINDPTDDSAPAYSELRFRRQRTVGGLEEENWLLAESWWAETFEPPGFKELAQWGFRIIPATGGSHFGAQVNRILADRPAKGSRKLQSWIWNLRLAAAVLQLIFGLMLCLVLLGVFALMLLVGLLPIPQVRQGLLELQLKISSTLGDSYILVSRPIEAASIVGQVRRDIDWLSNRCNAVVVVAHSQGGAVAHEAVRKGVSPKLKLLFTFGSGLKKLEQLKWMFHHGNTYLRSAAYTLVAILLFGLTASWFVVGALSGHFLKPEAELLGPVTAVALWAVLSFVFLVAGIRDHVRGIDLPALKRWVRRIRKESFDWIDCYAASDPVSNGELLEEADGEKWSKEVCNKGSIISDHTSYWENRDQFLTLLLDRLADTKLREEMGLPPATDLVTEKRRLGWIGKRRRWRVGISNAIGWVAAVSVLLVGIVQAPAIRDFVAYWASLFYNWGANLTGIEPLHGNDYSISWPAMGFLLMVLVPYWITKKMWRSWNDSEMQAVIRYRKVDMPIFVMVGLFAQLLFAAGLLYGDFPPKWVFFAVLFVPIIVAVLTRPGDSEEGSVVPMAARHHVDKTFVDKGLKVLDNGFEILAAPFLYGLLGWMALTWIADKYYSDLFPGLRAGEIPSVAIGVAVALVYGLVYFVWNRIRTARQS